MLYSPTSTFLGSQARPATQHVATRPTFMRSGPCLVPRLWTTGLPAPWLTNACGGSHQKSPIYVRETSYVHTAELPQQSSRALCVTTDSVLGRHQWSLVNTSQTMASEPSGPSSKPRTDSVGPEWGLGIHISDEFPRGAPAGPGPTLRESLDSHPVTPELSYARGRREGPGPGGTSWQDGGDTGLASVSSSSRSGLPNKASLVCPFPGFLQEFSSPPSRPNPH